MLFAFYAFLRIYMSISQLNIEVDITHGLLRQHVEGFVRMLKTPAISLFSLSGIDRFYVSAVKKGHERDRESGPCAIWKRGRGTYEGDKPIASTLIDDGSD
jgi:hypothetical protein